ncbi:universal stress protein [Sphingomonas sp. TDK1]|uniref:universal stress protein n=1 Tax=Sphingomonas sp. TDK1 TaxID=453247 RepID=UPI0007D91376|nr:universal stress protein [Sphingomonas sp. TDK1]OAN64938.1 hypothetical protein A7X12_16315 [Sphingomonas sp. TDK1]
MKNVLLLVHDDGGQEARFQAALDLSRAVDGHLTCLDVTYTPTFAGGDPFYNDAYLTADLVTEEAAREASNKNKLQQRLAAEDVAWDWVDAKGDIAGCLKNASELADVIVTNRELEAYGAPDMRAATGDLVVRSGKPVLAVPADLNRLDLSNVLVAWDGSLCAACALRAAVPLLKAASGVTILEIQDGSVAAPAEEAAAYLSRHDIHPTVRRLPVGAHGAGKVLTEELSRGEHGLLVMGGFSHLRFVEALFGGVTREMLTNSPVPLFLAH